MTADKKLVKQTLADPMYERNKARLATMPGGLTYRQKREWLKFLGLSFLLSQTDEEFKRTRWRML